MTQPEYDWMDEARQIAAQCWCDPETQHKEMDAVLCESVARRIASWMRTGAQHARNEEYWRDRCSPVVAADHVSGATPAQPASTPEKSLRDMTEADFDAAHGVTASAPDALIAELKEFDLWCQVNNVNDGCVAERAADALAALQSDKAALASQLADVALKHEAAEKRIAELKSQLAEANKPPTGYAPCARLCEHWAFIIQNRQDTKRIAALESERDALVSALHNSNEMHKEVYSIVYQSHLDKGDRLQRIAVRVERYVPQEIVKRTHHG